MKAVRSILINPHERSVREVSVSTGNDRWRTELRQMIGAECLDVVQVPEDAFGVNGLFLMIDDEGLFKSKQGYTQCGDLVIAGPMLLCAECQLKDEGEEEEEEEDWLVDVTIDIDQVFEKLRFISAEQAAEILEAQKALAARLYREQGFNVEFLGDSLASPFFVTRKEQP